MLNFMRTISPGCIIKYKIFNGCGRPSNVISNNKIPLQSLLVVPFEYFKQLLRFNTAVSFNYNIVVQVKRGKDDGVDKVKKL